MGLPPFVAVGSKGMLQLHIRTHAHCAWFQPFQNQLAPDAVKRSPMLFGAADSSGG
jgi:hypothetical protein